MGYIAEIHNLVPCCSTCNESKGNSNWREWITSDAKGSPQVQAPEGLSDRIPRLEKFERETNPHVIRIDYLILIDPALWEKHWRNHDAVISMTTQSIDVADQIRDMVKDHMKSLTIGRTGRATEGTLRAAADAGR